MVTKEDKEYFFFVVTSALCPVLLFHTGGHSRESQIKADAVVNKVPSRDSVGRDHGKRFSDFDFRMYHVSFSLSNVLIQNF